MGGLAFVITAVLKTFFTGSVTPQSAGKA